MTEKERQEYKEKKQPKLSYGENVFMKKIKKHTITGIKDDIKTI